MLSDFDIKRFKTLAVFERRPEVTGAKQMCQVAEVSAQTREFGGRALMKAAAPGP